MELIGIGLASVGGMIVAPLYCLFLKMVVLKRQRVALFAFSISALLTLFSVVEALLVATLGPLSVRVMIGPAFYLIHFVLFLSFAPAIGCALLLNPIKFVAERSPWLTVSLLCWTVGVFSLLYHVYVAEALYGVNGVGGLFEFPF